MKRSSPAEPFAQSLHMKRLLNALHICRVERACPYHGVGIPWRLAYSERLSTDFYITDLKSGIRVLVKAGPDSKLIPLICESTLVQTTRNAEIWPPALESGDENFSGEARSLHLQGRNLVLDKFSVNGLIDWLSDNDILLCERRQHSELMGMLGRNNYVPMIVHPQEIFSTGCLAPKLLPVVIEGLIIVIPKTVSSQERSN